MDKNGSNGTLNMQSKTAKLTKLAMLTALSMVLMAAFKMIPGLGQIFSFGPGGFLEYDPADIPIFIGTFAFGPVGRLVMTVIVSLFQAVTFSAGSGPYGFLMHVIATGSFVIVAGNIYQVTKTKKGAIVALIMGTITMTAVMIPANLFITPLFFGMPRDAVYPLLPIIAAFNLGKAGFNSVITLLLYKSISRFLHK